MVLLFYALEIFCRVFDFSSIKQKYAKLLARSIGYSTVFCKIWDFICTSLRSTEIVLDER